MSKDRPKAAKATRVGVRPGASVLAQADTDKLISFQEMTTRRIEKALAARTRYLYVRPIVSWQDGACLITSPCCSRNVDPDGAVIDIARLAYSASDDCWQLFSKHHGSGTWLWQSQGRLTDMLSLLNRDPLRIFWQ